MTVEIMKVELNKCICERCGHIWLARYELNRGTSLPKSCQGCGSRLWNKKRVLVV